MRYRNKLFIIIIMNTFISLREKAKHSLTAHQLYFNIKTETLRAEEPWVLHQTSVIGCSPEKEERGSITSSPSIVPQEETLEDCRDRSK